ncbi:MAG: protein translocase subunit SecD, partial [Acutalibacteraceae bacterium]|nr:protein translocase subunit SecD [Acutalibacteraceae bacterium]
MGESALVAMGYAAIAALIFMVIFLIVMYRLPGFIAVIALLGQLALSVAAVSGFFTVIPSFTMTLPGIAGMILSIGMGADANIITAERVREEIRAGKTIDGAVMTGTKGSFWAIFDGNVTVIIVAVILLLVFGPVNILSGIFGPSTTGTIYAFGYTLLVGVISNFIMGVAA